MQVSADQIFVSLPAMESEAKAGSPPVARRRRHGIPDVPKAPKGIPKGASGTRRPVIWETGV